MSNRAARARVNPSIMVGHAGPHIRPFHPRLGCIRAVARLTEQT